MKILKFTTNIENGEMLDTLAPFLDQEKRISQWNLDTESPEKILSVSGEELTPDLIVKAVESAGFDAKTIRVQAIGGHDL